MSNAPRSQGAGPPAVERSYARANLPRAGTGRFHGWNRRPHREVCRPTAMMHGRGQSDSSVPTKPSHNPRHPARGGGGGNGGAKRTRPTVTTAGLRAGDAYLTWPHGSTPGSKEGSDTGLPGSRYASPPSEQCRVAAEYSACTFPNHRFAGQGHPTRRMIVGRCGSRLLRRLELSSMAPRRL